MGQYKNYKMSFCIFISLVLASAVSSIELGCGDYSYNLCHDPPANQELHVGSLEECIQNCDLFASFDQCDYLLYWETGPDENCKIITSDGTTAGTCIEGPNDECAAGCTAGCQDCTADSCNGYRETQCQMEDNPGESSDLPPDYATCLTYCT